MALCISMSSYSDIYMLQCLATEPYSIFGADASWKYRSYWVPRGFHKATYTPILSVWRTALFSFQKNVMRRRISATLDLAWQPPSRSTPAENLFSEEASNANLRHRRLEGSSIIDQTLRLFRVTSISAFYDCINFNDINPISMRILSVRTQNLLGFLLNSIDDMHRVQYRVKLNASMTPLSFASALDRFRVDYGNHYH